MGTSFIIFLAVIVYSLAVVRSSILVHVSPIDEYEYLEPFPIRHVGESMESGVEECVLPFPWPFNFIQFNGKCIPEATANQTCSRSNSTSIGKHSCANGSICCLGLKPSRPAFPQTTTTAGSSSEESSPSSEVSTEASSPSSEVSTEPSSPSIEVSTEASSSSIEVSTEASSPSSEVSTEASSPSSETRIEATPSTRRRKRPVAIKDGRALKAGTTEYEYASDDVPSSLSLPVTQNSPSPSSAPTSHIFTTVPDDLSSCNAVTNQSVSYFQNPSYPVPDINPDVCQHIIIPANDTCAIRFEFLEVLMEGRIGDSCSVDSLQIINSLETPAAPQCGILDGYQFTVRTKPRAFVRTVVTAQSKAHLWKIKVSQVPCSKIKPLSGSEYSQCGKKGPANPLGNKTPDTTSLSAKEFLKSKLTNISEVRQFSVVEKLLVDQLIRHGNDIKIYEGNETALNEYPWQALLVVGGRPICGGTLINNQWILTAGHCTVVNIRFPLSVLLMADLGDHDLRTNDESPNRVYRVSKIVPHIQYQAISQDIALIKLASKVEFTKAISPACLPNNKGLLYDGKLAVTTGWGKTEKQLISPVLKQAELQIVSIEECRAAWNNLGEGGSELIKQEMICAGGGLASPCNGDSGGPLVLEEQGKWKLIGLTSFGALKGCGLPGIPAVYTRVTSYLDWIALNLPRWTDFLIQTYTEYTVYHRVQILNRNNFLNQ